MKAEELARWVRAEHEKVGELMERLEDRVNCVPKANQGQWLDEVRKDFGHFRAHITKHMALEEQDGYMVPVIERRPAFSNQVDRLAHEHKEFTRMMDNIHVLLEEMKVEDQLLIRDCCHRIHDLLSYVEHHQNEENLMVLSVFTDDIGTTD